jgi:hypothetical protein
MNVAALKESICVLVGAGDKNRKKRGAVSDVAFPILYVLPSR